MTRAKWVHKRDLKMNDTLNYAVCGTITQQLMFKGWTNKITCPKCLAKKPTPRKPKTNVSFELDGKVFVVERTEKGKVVSQEEIDGEVILKLLVSVLEEALLKYEKNHNPR